MRKTGDEDVEDVEQRTQPSFSATCWTESGAFPPKSLRQTKLVLKVLHRKSFFCHKKKRNPDSRVARQVCADVHCCWGSRLTAVRLVWYNNQRSALWCVRRQRKSGVSKKLSMFLGRWRVPATSTSSRHHDSLQSCQQWACGWDGTYCIVVRTPGRNDRRVWWQLWMAKNRRIV